MNVSTFHMQLTTIVHDVLFVSVSFTWNKTYLHVRSSCIVLQVYVVTEFQGRQRTRLQLGHPCLQLLDL